jgi:hypothetical protein
MEEELQLLREKELGRLQSQGRRKKVEIGVRFSGDKLRGFPCELSEAEEVLELKDKGLKNETVRTLNGFGMADELASRDERKGLFCPAPTSHDIRSL